MIDDEIKLAAKKTLMNKLEKAAEENRIWGSPTTDRLIKSLLHSFFEEKVGIEVDKEAFINILDTPARKRTQTLTDLALQSEIKKIETGVVAGVIPNE